MKVIINPYHKSVTIDGVEVVQKFINFPDALNHLASISCDYDRDSQTITDVQDVHRYVSHAIEKQYYYKHLPEFVDWFYVEQQAQLDNAISVEQQITAANTAAQNAATSAEKAKLEAEEAKKTNQNTQQAVDNAVAKLTQAGSTLPVKSDGTDIARTLGERFADVVNVKDFGAVGDGVTDDTAAIQEAFDKASTHRSVIVLPPGVYRITDSLYRHGCDLDIMGNGATIFYDSENQLDMLHFSGTKKQENVLYPAAIEEDDMVIANVFNGIEAGDLIHIETSQMLETETRDSWHYGYLVKVNRISDMGVHLSDPIPKRCYAPKTLTATVSTISGKNAVLANLNVDASEARVRAYVNNDTTKVIYIAKWDNTTKSMTFTEDVSGVLTADDTLTLVWETKCHVYKPISVNIKGIKIERPVVMNGRTYRGLRLQWARDCTIENVEVMNFSEACVRLDFCYKVNVRNSVLFGANRIYTATPYTADGVGYGVQHSGCSFCTVDGCDIKACRGGWTTANARCITYHSLIKNNTFTAPEGLSYLGERLSPEVPIDKKIVEGEENPLKSYAIGGHGCGFDCIYQGNHIIDYPMGSKERGENPHFLNNTFTGAVYRAINLSASKGGLVIGNIYNPSKKYDHTAFMRVDLAKVNMDAPIYAESNIGVSEAGAMFSFGSFSSQENRVRNFHARGNRAHINGNLHGSDTAEGVSGGTDGFPLIIDSSCSFAHNTITYDDSIIPSKRHGFVGMFYSCTLADNSYAEIDDNVYAVKLLANGGDCKIPLKTRNSTFVLDIAGISGPGIYVTGIAYSAGLDRSPVTKTYTNSASSSQNRVFIAKSENDLPESYNGIVIYHVSNAYLGIRNMSGSDITALIRLSCGLFS